MNSRWFVWVLVAFLVACSSAAPEGGSEAFSVHAASPVSVDLAWQAVEGATGYLLEAKYGDGEFFQIAELSWDETSYTDFLIPNSSNPTYRLSAIPSNGRQETALVDIPEFKTNPMVLGQAVQFAPVVGEMELDFASLPTIDPQNPDPNAIATLTAFNEQFSNLSPEDMMPEVTLVAVTQGVGPEGGTIELTDPNGVTFSLGIRANAIQEEVTFTISPIESIAEFPFQVLGAVQVFPQIPFDVPLALRVTLPESAPEDQTVVGFVASSFNSELSLTPVFQEGNTYLLNVYWGDVVGIATATHDQVSAQAARIPSDSAEQISQQIAVMQALGDDRSLEAFSAIIGQILGGLLQQESVGEAFQERAREAAPLRQSQSGIILWDKISATRRAWSEDQFHSDYDTSTTGGNFNPLASVGCGDRCRAELITKLTDEIKEFLDTHTGCRTRDELYAEALLQILRHPEGDFEQRIQTGFNARFGDPEGLKNCTFMLHIVSSRMVQALEGSTVDMTVHVDPFELEAIVRGGKISLRGVGGVVYEDYTFLYHVCPPEIDATKPSGSLIWVTDLSPVYDQDFKVIGFSLNGIVPDQSAVQPLGGGSAELNLDSGDCRITKFDPDSLAFDMWAGFVSFLHNKTVGLDNWAIVGEDSYVATNKIIGYTQGPVTENSTMVLTVNQSDGGTQ